MAIALSAFAGQGDALGAYYFAKEAADLDAKARAEAGGSGTCPDAEGGKGGAAATADTTRRPSGFRKNTVKKAWDDAKDGSEPGTRACPDCGTDIKVKPGEERRDWDIDHDPKRKDCDLIGTRKEVLDKYNEDVRFRCPSCNRSDNQ